MLRKLLLMFQVMRVDKSVLGKGQAQYIANIALKVNVKRGGLNHTVSEPLFRKTRWMMLGGKAIYTLDKVHGDCTRTDSSQVMSHTPARRS